MKTLIKDLVYFSRKFFMNIKSMTIRSTNFCGNSFKRQKQHEMAKTNKSREASSGIYGSSGGVFEGGGLIRGEGGGQCEDLRYSFQKRTQSLQPPSPTEPPAKVFRSSTNLPAIQQSCKLC